MALDDTRHDSLRVPPSAIAAEQAVIGGLMLDPKAINRVGGMLVEDDLYRHDHRLIFRAIVELHSQGEPYDVVTLGDWFESNGLADQVGMGYLIELANNTPSAANVAAYAGIVREKAMLRRLIEAGTELVNAGFAGERSASDVVADTAAALTSLVPATTGATRSPKASMHAWFQALQERMSSKSEMVGLPTPWREVNELTKGLRPGRVYVVAGRSSMGKSVIGCQLASFAALRGTRTAMFSLEMSDEEVRDRNVAALSGVPYAWLEAPVESDSERWSATSSAVSELIKAPLLIDDTPSLTAAQVCYRANSLHLDDPLGLVVVDHLHELKIDGKTATDRVDGYGEAMRLFKALAKTLRIPVVVLAQINRASRSNEGGLPTMDNLRASGRIEEVADVVFLLHRPDHYEPETHLKGVVQLTVGKGRNVRGGATINLRNRYDVMRADDWEGPLPIKPEAPKSQPTRWRGKDKAAGADF